MKQLIDLLLIILGLLLLWIVVTSGDEFIVLGQKISLRNPQNPATLFVVLGLIRLYFYTKRFPLTHPSHVYDWALISLLMFILAVVVVKTFVGLIALNHFHLVLDGEDWKHTYSTDLALALLGLVVILVLGWLARQGKTALFLTIIANFGLLIVAVGAIVAAVIYVVIGYAYFEWGSYVEPQHFEAMRMAGVGSEANDLLFRWRTLMAIGVLLGLWWLATKTGDFLRSSGARLWLISGLGVALVPALLTAELPVKYPKKVAPSVQSPLLMLLRPVSGNMDGVNADYLLNTMQQVPGGYQPTRYPPDNANQAIKAPYQSLSAIAKGKNVVFYVMESVRRQSLELYGYHRQTMPALNTMADNALVFDQAYVVQPRSSKAYTALGLGVTPDPRLRPLSWQPERVLGQDSLINRLIDDGRRFYIGTSQPRGSDKMEEFYDALSNQRVEAIVTRETLQPSEFSANDKGLSQAFVSWAKQSTQPFVSLLWTECAHMPYKAPISPFGQQRLIDKYDNCLRSIDDALAELVKGLTDSGQLDDTLLVILGDHGEALGEKFDRGHGNYLYEHSLRIPVVIYNPALFEQRVDVSARFQIKDIPSTLLYLLGLDDEINQSINIFSKGDRDTLFFSNVYQDFKLGFLSQQIKFIYRPTYDLVSIFDLQSDPDENINIVNRYSREELVKMKKRALLWYRFHTRHIEQLYPKLEQ